MAFLLCEAWTESSQDGWWDCDRRFASLHRTITNFQCLLVLFFVCFLAPLISAAPTPYCFYSLKKGKAGLMKNKTNCKLPISRRFLPFFSRCSHFCWIAISNGLFKHTWTVSAWLFFFCCRKAQTWGPVTLANRRHSSEPPIFHTLGLWIILHLAGYISVTCQHVPHR